MSTNRHIVCPKCLKTNRVPDSRLHDNPKCGACGGLLFTGEPVAADTPAFDRHVNAGEIPVLADIWAAWCGPCRMMAPMFARAAQRLEPHARLLKVNMDEAPDIARRFGIQSVPTLLLLHKGRLAAQTAGAMDTDRIVAWAQSHMPPVNIHS